MSEAREDEDEASVASALRPLGGVGGKFLAHGGDGLVSEGGGHGGWAGTLTYGWHRAVSVQHNSHKRGYLATQKGTLIKNITAYNPIY